MEKMPRESPRGISVRGCFDVSNAGRGCRQECRRLYFAHNPGFHYRHIAGSPGYSPARTPAEKPGSSRPCTNANAEGCSSGCGVHRLSRCSALPGNHGLPHFGCCIHRSRHSFHSSHCCHRCRNCHNCRYDDTNGSYPARGFYPSFDCASNPDADHGHCRCHGRGVDIGHNLDTALGRCWYWQRLSQK